MPTPKSNRIQTARHNIEFAVDLTQRRKWFAEGEGESGGDATKTDSTSAAAETITEAKFTQVDMDKIAGNRAKEAAANAVKKLLKDLGIENPDDPKALETVKGKLTAAQEAENAKKSAEDKLQEQLTALQKERDDALATANQIKTERLAEMRDNGIKEALRDPKVHCRDAAKVFKLLKADHAAELEAAMKADGTLDAEKVKALVDLGKKENPEYFTGNGPGIPSNAAGRASDIGREARQYASASNQDRIRG